MKFTRNFSREEFTFSQTASRKGIDNTLPSELYPNMKRVAEWLQTFRDRLSEHFGKDTPIFISSGYRCPELNKAIGGSKTSAHMHALAADIHVQGQSIEQLQKLVFDLMGDKPYDQCIDEFGRWVHVGLAEEGSKPRMELMTARKEVTGLNRVRTAYRNIRL